MFTSCVAWCRAAGLPVSVCSKAEISAVLRPTAPGACTPSAPHLRTPPTEAGVYTHPTHTHTQGQVGVYHVIFNNHQSSINWLLQWVCIAIQLDSIRGSCLQDRDMSEGYRSWLPDELLSSVLHISTYQTWRSTLIVLQREVTSQLFSWTFVQQKI